MRRILIIAVVLGLLAGGGLAWLYRDMAAFLGSPLPIAGDAVDYTVPTGRSYGQIVRDLSRRGLVVKPRYLIGYGRWRGDAQRIKAGEYRIAAGTTVRGLLALLTSGAVLQHRITLVEGWTYAQALAALHREERIMATLPPVSVEPAAVLRALGLREPSPEGLFLPETYYFVRGATDVSILGRAYRAMQDYVRAQWATRAEGLALHTPYEAIILASIIEKETALTEERAEIAGVFLRRLERNMRLETDPSVIYGLGTGFDGNLTRAHLTNDTPYNTYVHRGLPPTPIALPGRDAIKAALHPAAGRALYFVARGDGSHAFSTDYPAHQRAVHEYQHGRRR